MPPKKRLYQWQATFSDELGLRVNSHKIDGIVDAAVYSFCKFWGRKDKDGKAVDSAGGKHNQTMNNKH